MSVPTVQVTIKLNDQSGAPVPGARVIARLTSTERYQGYVVPKEYTGEAGADGIAVVNIFPNELGSEGSEYIFKITDPRTNKTVRVYASIPNTNCELHSVAELDRYELRGAGEIITAEVATYAGQAATSAGQAAASASAAATSKTGADTAKAGADTAKAGADTAKAGADAAKVAAQAAQTGAETARSQAQTYMGAAQDASDGAAAQASVATTKAAESAASATSAATQAGTATTKAGEAATSATAANTAKTGAESAKTGAETARDLANSYAGAAATSKGQAEAARDLSSAYATASDASRAKAAEWAEKTSGTVETGAYSAKYHAQLSATSASAAATSATAAQAAQTAAEAAAAEAAEIAAGAMPDASETARGVLELATAAEVQAGTDAVRAVTPATLAAEITRRATPLATEGTAGKALLASLFDIAAGSDTSKIVTPAGLSSRVSSESATGLIRTATATEATEGANDATAMTPAKVKARVDALRSEITGKNIAVTAPITGGGSLSGTTITIGIGDASDTAKGAVELATSAEVIAGTDAARAVTPAAALALANAKFEGFDQTTSRHKAFSGSALSDIAVNSIYGFSKDAISDGPADMAAGTWGFVHTMMYGAAMHGTQIVYSMTLPHNIWMRRKATTWGSWSRVYATVEAKAASFTATPGSIYLCNAGITVTLPAAPTQGDRIRLVPNQDISGANKVTLDPGALKIMGSTTEYKDFDKNIAIELVYTIPAWGWQI